MNIEYEIRVLEINRTQIEEQLNKLGAKLIKDVYQKRYTYDFTPPIENKWIRLRTDGKEATLCVKHITDENKADGVLEWETGVTDFEETNLILNQLGYTAKNYQENKRKLYKINDTEICIDSWPLIPTYMEIEGKSEEAVNNFLKELKLENPKTTTLNTTSIYKKFYNINISEIPQLKF